MRNNCRGLGITGLVLPVLPAIAHVQLSWCDGDADIEDLRLEETQEQSSFPIGRTNQPVWVSTL